MKLIKKSNYLMLASFVLLMSSMSANVYASSTNATYTSSTQSKEDSLLSKKRDLLGLINAISNDLKLDPAVVLASYIELGGTVFDSELSFRADGNSWGNDKLLAEAKKISNKKLSLPQNTTIKDTYIDDIRFITYNNSDLEKECIEIYSGVKSGSSNARLQLKQNHLKLAKFVYADWVDELSVKDTTINTNVGTTKYVNKTTKFNWLVDRGRLKGQPLRITSQYAYRDGGQMHRALDFATKEFIGENGKAGELNLYPVHDAKVIKVQTNPNSSTGLAVWYEFKDVEGDNYSISYMHMSSLGNIGVGSTVSVGDVLGTTGSTGDATGIHIHVQVDKNGQRINPLRLWGYDPLLSEKSREKWVDGSNLVIPCMGECIQYDGYNITDKEFSIVKCLEHRSK